MEQKLNGFVQNGLIGDRSGNGSVAPSNDKLQSPQPAQRASTLAFEFAASGGVSIVGITNNSGGGAVNSTPTHRKRLSRVDIQDRLMVSATSSPSPLVGGDADPTSPVRSPTSPSANVNVELAKLAIESRYLRHRRASANEVMIKRTVPPPPPIPPRKAPHGLVISSASSKTLPSPSSKGKQASKQELEALPPIPPWSPDFAAKSAAAAAAATAAASAGPRSPRSPFTPRSKAAAASAAQLDALQPLSPLSTVLAAFKPKKRRQWSRVPNQASSLAGGGGGAGGTSSASSTPTRPTPAVPAVILSTPSLSSRRSGGGGGGGGSNATSPITRIEVAPATPITRLDLLSNSPPASSPRLRARFSSGGGSGTTQQQHHLSTASSSSSTANSSPSGYSPLPAMPTFTQEPILHVDVSDISDNEDEDDDDDDDEVPESMIMLSPKHRASSGPAGLGGGGGGGGSMLLAQVQEEEPEPPLELDKMTLGEAVEEVTKRRQSRQSRHSRGHSVALALAEAAPDRERICVACHTTLSLDQASYTLHGALYCRNDLIRLFCSCTACESAIEFGQSFTSVSCLHDATPDLLPTLELLPQEEFIQARLAVLEREYISVKMKENAAKVAAAVAMAQQAAAAASATTMEQNGGGSPLPSASPSFSPSSSFSSSSSSIPLFPLQPTSLLYHTACLSCCALDHMPPLSALDDASSLASPEPVDEQLAALDSLSSRWFQHEGRVYCMHDYLTMYGEYCAQCRQIITGGSVSALNQQWHADCFLCAGDCGRLLNKDKFYEAPSQFVSPPLSPQGKTPSSKPGTKANKTVRQESKQQHGREEKHPNKCDSYVCFSCLLYCVGILRELLHSSLRILSFLLPAHRLN